MQELQLIDEHSDENPPIESNRATVESHILSRPGQCRAFFLRASMLAHVITSNSYFFRDVEAKHKWTPSGNSQPLGLLHQDQC